MISCKDCLEALHPYIDRELSDDDIVQVQVHLNECGGCDHFFRFEASLRRLVRVRCQQTQAPDSLRERIQQRLAAEAERMQGSSGPVVRAD